jgi:ribosomal protein S18 acetylase RimI-like enzyme
MLIRPAKKLDLKNCLKISLEDNENYWTLIDFEKSVSNKDVIFLVADNGDYIVGYIIGFFVPTKKVEVAIHETRVLNEYRGKKIGTNLVDEFCKVAFSCGAKKIYAEIEKNLSNFYIDSCNFKKIANWLEFSKIK